MNKPTVAIVGATGAVGQQMLQCLEERQLDISLKLFASPRSKGKVYVYQGQKLEVEVLEESSFINVDYCLGATDNAFTKQWIPWAQKHKCVVIDNSSAYRIDPSVPLVIPEINAQDIKNHQGIIANPNCATIIALVALHALHQAFNIQRMIVTTFQAVSGAGMLGIQDLQQQIKDPTCPPQAFPYPIAFNLIPQIGEFDEQGITQEEWKMQKEAIKIWHHPQLKVNCTCVRVPIWRSHSESITITCKKEIDIQFAKEVLSHAKGVKVVDDPKQKKYPMPLDTTNQDLVYVGRIREDLSDSTHHSLSLFCCGDQIRKGAATNAVQILELLLNQEKKCS